MAKSGAPDIAFLLIGGRSILGDVTDISGPKVEPILEDSHPLGTAWPECDYVGLNKATLGFKGFFNDRVSGMNEALVTGINDAFEVLCLGRRGNVEGRPFVGIAGVGAATYDTMTVRNELVKAVAELAITGHVDEGIILQSLATKTADWNTEGADSQDASASTANGGAAYLQVTALSGFTGFVGKVRHSADDVTYADLATFANVTAAPAAQRVAVAAGATVERYLAFTGDVTGSGSITAMAGFARG